MILKLCINFSFSIYQQFKVLRGGCWQKLNFERENQQMSKVNPHNDFIASPWIQHYRSSIKQESAVAPSPTAQQVVISSQRKKISSKAGQLHMYESQVYHENMLCSDTGQSNILISPINQIVNYTSIFFVFLNSHTNVFLGSCRSVGSKLC